MNIVRHHQPGTTTVLFDQAIHQRFRGSLYFDPRFETLKPLEPSVQKFSGITKTLALTALIISCLGFSVLLLPVAVSAVSLKFAQATTTLAPLKASPSPSSITSAEPIIQMVNQDEFRIVIPKGNLESDIIGNVDTNSEEKYLEALKLGVAHAQGSYLPNEKGPVILFAHSTDSIINIMQHNAKFYAVRDLVPGDDIFIQYQGKRYHYIVQEQTIIDPTDLDSLRNSKADLILETCYPPGTDWQRLITFARLVS